MNGTGIFLCNFSGMIKNALPSLRQGGPARKGSAADKKASAAALPVTPSRKPRTCGEKQLLIARHFDDARITPACAGKSGRQDVGCKRQRDHPRTCGEKYCCTLMACRNWGSPPHMRGKDVHQSESEKPHGITPAHAGKSGTWGVTSPDSRDHPRTCGEKRDVGCNESGQTGSPPHMRGKVRAGC